MPVSHRRNQRVPVDLPPKLMELLETTSKETGIQRTKLLRLLVIDGVKQLTFSDEQKAQSHITYLHSLESPVVLNNLYSKGLPKPESN